MVKYGLEDCDSSPIRKATPIKYLSVATQKSPVRILQPAPLSLMKTHTKGLQDIEQKLSSLQLTLQRQSQQEMQALDKLKADIVNDRGKVAKAYQDAMSQIAAIDEHEKKIAAQEQARVDAAKKELAKAKALEEQKAKDAVKAKEEAEKKAEEEKKRLQLKPEKVEVKSPLKDIKLPSTPVKSSPLRSSITANDTAVPLQDVSEEAWDEAQIPLNVVNEIKTTLKPKLLANNSLADQLMRVKMKINKSVGQLTNSQSQIVAKAKEISETFTNSQKTSDEVYKVVMYLTAKKVVKQAETEIAVKTEQAFPIAIICVYLMNKHPAFKDVLMGRFMKKCQFLIPCYPKKQPNEASEDFFVRCGYKKMNGALETEMQFGERMAGIISLFAAIVQTNDMPNSFGIDNGWKWIARILNLIPRKVTPIFIQSFLQIAGHLLLKEYGEQGMKLVHYIIEQVIPRIPKTAVASATKLQLYLEETVMRNNSFPPHPGRKLAA